jgi:hypothetical protein
VSFEGAEPPSAMRHSLMPLPMHIVLQCQRRCCGRGPCRGSRAGAQAAGDGAGDDGCGP